MEEINRLFEFVRSIRSPKMCTNSFFTPMTLAALGEQRPLQIILGNRAAILLHPDEGNVFRLFFYVADPDAIEEVATLIPSLAPSHTCVCDILGKEAAVEPLLEPLARAEFQYYARFQRMIRKEIPAETPLDLSAVEPAAQQDAQEILDMLYSEFDPLTAHFPSLDRVRKLIEDQEVFLIRADGRIAGFTSFESRHKQVACLGFVITRPEYRGQMIARKILAKKLICYNESKHYYLWINELMHDAVLTHEKNLFFKDGMYDYIFTIEERK